MVDSWDRASRVAVDPEPETRVVAVSVGGYPVERRPEGAILFATSGLTWRPHRCVA